jgi:hypothetical protein
MQKTPFTDGAESYFCGRTLSILPLAGQIVNSREAARHADLWWEIPELFSKDGNRSKIHYLE